MFFGFGLGEVVVILVVSLCLCALATSLAMESIALFLPTFLLVFPALLPNFPALTANDAIGLTLIIMFFGQTSTLSGYWYRGQVDLRIATAAVSITIPLAVFGRFGTYLVPEWVLLVLFAVLLFGLAAVIARYHGHEPAADAATPDGGRETPHTSNGCERDLDSRAVRVVFDRTDRLAYGVGGLLGGGLGFATGELSNTTLTVRNAVPVSISTGTSTLVLYLTVLTANVTNLLIVYHVPIGTASEVTVPWGVAAIAAPAVLVGGQLGSFFNDRLPSRAIIGLLVASYVVVGVVTLARLFV